VSREIWRPVKITNKNKAVKISKKRVVRHKKKGPYLSHEIRPLDMSGSESPPAPERMKKISPGKDRDL